MPRPAAQAPARVPSRRAHINGVSVSETSIEIRTATDSVSTVDVIEERAGEWAVVSSSVPAEKLSSTRTRFRTKVPARGEAAVTYRLRIIW